LGNPEENSSQLVEMHDSEDEQPPQLEGGENEEEELEENEEEESKEETEHFGEEEEEEAEKPGKSPLQIPLQEDELAHILANMGEYIQPHNPLNPDIEAGPSQEHSSHNKSASEEMNDEEEEKRQSQEHFSHSKSASREMSDEEEEEGQFQGHFAHSRSASEEMHNEEEVEEAAREIEDQPRASTLEKSNYQDENIEEVFQAENKEIFQGEGTIPKEQSPSPRKETGSFEENK